MPTNTPQYPAMFNSTHQARIERMMLMAGQEVPNYPTLPPPAVRVLRAALILEEALETIHALGCNVKALSHGSLPLDGVPVTIRNVELSARPDNLHSPEHQLHMIADGCGDLSVVTIGTLSACGIVDTPILEAIDKNNLAKFDPEAGGYRSDGTDGNPAGKWIKPPGHKPPDWPAVFAPLYPPVPSMVSSDKE